MKTIKLFLSGIFIMFLCFSTINAQTHKTNTSNVKKIQVLDVPSELTFLPASGNELIIESEGYEKPPKRADGLKSLTNTAIDNTGIGLEVTNEGGIIKIRPASKQTTDMNFIIKVPNGIAIEVEYNTPFGNGDIMFTDLSNDIEVNSLNPDMEFKNVTGPLTVYAINGEIKITINSLSQERPTSITAINGDIDISLPSNTKAELLFETINGDIFTDFDLKMDNKDKDLKFIGGHDIDGTINGGGVKLNLKTINNNIYLRKK